MLTAFCVLGIYYIWKLPLDPKKLYGLLPFADEATKESALGRRMLDAEVTKRLRKQLSVVPRLSVYVDALAKVVALSRYGDQPPRYRQSIRRLFWSGSAG